MANEFCTTVHVEKKRHECSVTGGSADEFSSDFLVLVDCSQTQQQETTMSPASSSSTTTPRSSSWLADQISNFHNGHERVKNAVHSYWRQNTILSPRTRVGKVVMGSFYFSLPVIFGYIVVNKVVEGSESTVRERIGDGNLRDTESPKIGAGGWGGGVHLVASDRATQERNRINLERFLKKQRKLKEKRDRRAALDEQQ